MVWIPGPIVGLPLRVAPGPAVYQMSGGGQNERDPAIDETGGGCDVAGSSQRRVVLLQAMAILGGGMLLVRLLRRRKGA